MSFIIVAFKRKSKKKSRPFAVVVKKYTVKTWLQTRTSKNDYIIDDASNILPVLFKEINRTAATVNCQRRNQKHIIFSEKYANKLRWQFGYTDCK